MPLEVKDWDAFEYQLKGGYKHRLGLGLAATFELVLYWEPHAEHVRADGTPEMKSSFTLDSVIDMRTTRYRFDTLEEAVAIWNVHERRIAVAIAERAMRLH